MPRSAPTRSRSWSASRFRVPSSFRSQIRYAADSMRSLMRTSRCEKVERRDVKRTDVEPEHSPENE